jgi:hypothetical protein
MDNKPTIKTFFAFLQEGYTAAQLATAVENVGVYGWDRFGRFAQHGKDSPGAQEALNVLAVFFREEGRFTEGLDRWQRLYQSKWLADPEDPDFDFSAEPIHMFGWPVGMIPEMTAAINFPPPPSRKRRSSEETPTLHVLGALLLCLSDLRKTGVPKQIPPEDALIGMMEERFPGVKWVARNTIQYQFADSKKAVQRA